jgi:error-prone DNA polymerase
VQVAGIIVIRQRPGTAKGFLFITMEDEAGFINVVVKPNQVTEFGRVVTDGKALVVAGVLEKKDGVINVIGKDFRPLEFLFQDVQIKSRDFR